MKTLMESVSTNAWVTGPLLLTLRFYVAGVAWAWLLPWLLSPGRRTWQRWVCCAAVALTLGTLLSVLGAFLLAELGLFTPVVDCILLAAVILVGGALGAARVRAGFMALVKDALPGLIVFLLGVMTIMHLPRQTEWVAGGWDPGVYLNQGVAVARTGTFHPGPDPALKLLTKDEFSALTRGDPGYRAVLVNNGRLRAARFTPEAYLEVVLKTLDEFAPWRRNWPTAGLRWR